MAHLHADIHCHRTPMTPEDHRLLFPQAAEIARTRMEAFRVPFEINADDGPTLEIWTNPHNHAQDVLNFPKPSGTGLSFQHKRHHDWFVSYVAAVETALAWQQAGLIHHFCDLFRWDRNPDWNPLLTTQANRDQIADGLANLGLPHRPPHHQHLPGLNPDPAATLLARQLMEHLNSPKVIVFLTGSRARGDHNPDSDTDLLLYLDDTRAAPTQKLLTKTRKFLQEAQARTSQDGHPLQADVQLVDMWEKPRWQHHSRKLAPPAPNGLAFTTNPDLLNKVPVSMPDQPGIRSEQPFYFLTCGATATDVFSGDWCTKDVLDLQRCK